MSGLRPAALAALALLASGCVSYPDERRSGLAPAPAPATLSVMTYNIEGLGWPARTGREPFLEGITAEFARMKQAGVLPDVIVFQEAFSTAALRTAASTGHPDLALGPRAPTRSRLSRTRDPVLKKRNYLHGEWGIRFTGSGLAIASRYPIIASYTQPYGPSSCAGWDCLSNKSAMLVRIALPGLAEPIEIATTHMNSQGASAAPPDKQLAAHNVQSAELAAFLDRVSNPDSPLVLGGDFNMRRSPARFEEFERRNGYQLARRYCLQAQPEPGAPRCEIVLSFDGDEPWLDTQDLQIYDDGTHLALRPVRIEAWFDGADSGGKLSDHDAYIVTYAIVPVAAGAGVRADRPGGAGTDPGPAR